MSIESERYWLQVQYSQNFILQQSLQYEATYLVVLAGLTNLETLNLDSCKVDDEGMAHLAGFISFLSVLLFVLFPKLSPSLIGPQSFVILTLLSK